MVVNLENLILPTQIELANQIVTRTNQCISAPVSVVLYWATQHWSLNIHVIYCAVASHAVCIEALALRFIVRQSRDDNNKNYQPSSSLSEIYIHMISSC